ncbi:single-stranded DNA-binding protein [Candidatus Babeliales bacterium]|nr:single-stranded DNA-binding protein [Candidatus Babeliales bacterium]
MSSFNRIILMGNLTRDPELKQLDSGQSVCRLGLAVNRQYKNNQGAMVQEVCYVDIDFWGAQAESSNKYLEKGRLVLIEGRLKLDTWETDGQKRSKHSIAGERITFMPTSGNSQTSDFDNKNNFGTASVDQSMTAKTQRSAPKIPRSKKTTINVETSGEVDLPDVQPFEDDLPF